MSFIITYSRGYISHDGSSTNDIPATPAIDTEYLLKVYMRPITNCVTLCHSPIYTTLSPAITVISCPIHCVTIQSAKQKIHRLRFDCHGVGKIMFRCQVGCIFLLLCKCGPRLNYKLCPRDVHLCILHSYDSPV